MKNIKIILLTFIVLSSNLYADEIILSQGKTSVTFEDIDGFAFRMPNDIRKNYFSDFEKVDKLLSSMLNYKHIYNYNMDKKLLDTEELTKRVDNEVATLFAYDDSTDNLLEKQSMFQKIRRFLKIKTIYKMIQEVILDSIDDESISELAEEKYTFNKKNYQIPETRTIRYLSIKKDDAKKESQLIILNNIKNKIIEGSLKFDDVASNYSHSKEIFTISDVLKNITYNNKSPKFSKYLFSTNKLGFIDGVLETKNAFLIIKILDITPSRLADYKDVKEMLTTEIKKDKASREFTNLLLKLTKDPVKINEANLALLAERYN